MLGSTLERVTLPDDLVARLEGKSSLGRLGLLIHSTAGFIDPGWDGHVTLELSNVANLPITIYVGMKIGQLSFVQMTEAAETPVRQRAGSGRSTRARQARRRAATGRTSRSRTDDPRHGSDGLRRAPRRRTRCASRDLPVRCLVRDRAQAASLESLGCELAAATSPTRTSVRAAAEGCDAVVHLVSIIAGRARGLRSGHGRRHVEPHRRGAEGGRRPLRAHERARDERGDARSSCPYYGAKWAMEQAVARRVSSM